MKLQIIWFTHHRVIYHWETCSQSDFDEEETILIAKTCMDLSKRRWQSP